MNINKKLVIWEKEKLISSEQGKAIMNFENLYRRPVLLYALSFLSIFCIGLGFVAIIASNWQAIPPFAKIGADIILLGLISWGVWAARIKSCDWAAEALIVLFAITIMASIGLIGQVYQLQSVSYRAYFLWSILSLPLLFFSCKTILPIIWWPLFIFSGLDFLASYEWFYKVYQILLSSFPFATSLALIVVLACIYTLISLFKKSDFSLIKAYRFWLIIIIFAEICFMDYGAGNVWVADLIGYSLKFSFNLWFVGTSTIIIFFMGLINYKARQSLLLPGVIASMFVFAAVYNFLPQSETILEMWGFLLSMSCLSLLVVYGIKHNQTRLINLATALMAVRIFIVYLQVFGSLMSTGIGLLSSGVVFLGVIFIWRRFGIKEYTHEKQ